MAAAVLAHRSILAQIALVEFSNFRQQISTASVARPGTSKAAGAQAICSVVVVVVGGVGIGVVGGGVLGWNKGRE